MQPGLLCVHTVLSKTNPFFDYREGNYREILRIKCFDVTIIIFYIKFLWTLDFLKDIYVCVHPLSVGQHEPAHNKVHRLTRVTGQWFLKAFAANLFPADISKHGS